MADEDMMEMDELGEDGEEEGSEEGGNPLMKYLPLIGGVLLIQVIIIYFAVQWFMPDDAPEEGEVAEAVVEETPETEGAEGFEPKPTSVAKVFDQLEVIVVNPAGTEGLRFLSTQVFLGLSSLKVEQHILENNLVYRINDTLVRILSSKTISDLDPSKHDELKEEIKKKLNAFLGPNAVLEVYFQSFVLQ